MSWLSEYVRKVLGRDLKTLTCFICGVKIVGDGAEIQYSYTEKGKHQLGKTIICLKCADELDKKNMGYDYDDSI
jgi:hypothetical protein